MQYTNILQYLEETVLKVPDKPAFCAQDSTLTFRQTYEASRAVGSFLYQKGYYKKPVVVFMKKTPEAIAAYLGVIYAGCFYVALDEEMPKHRIELIIQTVKAGMVICDETTGEMIREYGFDGEVCQYSQIVQTGIDEEALDAEQRTVEELQEDSVEADEPEQDEPEQETVKPKRYQMAI